MNTQLERLAAAEKMLAEIATAEDAVKVARLAEAARVWAQQAKLGTSSVNHATVIKMRAERRLADVVDEGQRKGEIATNKDGGRPSKKQPTVGGIKPTLEELGVQQQRLAEARKIRDQYSDDDLRGLEEQANEADEVLSRKDLILGRSDYLNRRSQVSSEWYTPSIYIEAARRVLGGIDLDPASCAEVNERTIRAARYYTTEDDGLSQEWKGRVWLNPPYQGQAGSFVTKLAESYLSGDVEAGIALLSAMTTDTQWFRPLWDNTLCFVYGRIRFEGGLGTSNTAGSVFVYFGRNAAEFQYEFEGFGAVVERRRP